MITRPLTTPSDSTTQAEQPFSLRCWHINTTTALQITLTSQQPNDLKSPNVSLAAKELKGKSDVDENVKRTQRDIYVGDTNGLK